YGDPHPQSSFMAPHLVALSRLVLRSGQQGLPSLLGRECPVNLRWMIIRILCRDNMLRNHNHLGCRWRWRKNRENQQKSRPDSLKRRSAASARDRGFHARNRLCPIAPHSPSVPIKRIPHGKLCVEYSTALLAWWRAPKQGPQTRHCEVGRRR